MVPTVCMHIGRLERFDGAMMGKAVVGLFAYGSLMAPDIMRRASGHEGSSTPATLHGYFRATIVDETYPGIVPATGESVAGVYYPNLTGLALARLDEFEGEMYERATVDVETAAGSIAAQVYVIRPGFRHLLTSTPWDFDDFMCSGYHRFIADYVGFDVGGGND